MVRSWYMNNRLWAQDSNASRLAVEFPLRLLILQLGLLVVAVLIGWSVTSPDGPLICEVIVALILLAGVAWAFRRDGPGTLLGLWLVQFLLIPGSALVGYTSSLGSAIRQANDVVTVVFVLLICWMLITERASLGPLRYVLAGVGVGVCGLASSIISQGELIVTLEGAWLGLKMWTLIAIALCVPWRAKDITRIFSVFLFAGVCVALVGMVDYITHGGVAATLRTSEYATAVGGGVYRADAIRALFATPGEYSLCMSLLFGVAIAAYVMWRRPRDLAAALLFAIAVALSLRLKGALSLGAVMATVMVCRGRRNRKVTGILAVGAVLAIGLLNFEGQVISRQVTTYATPGSESNVRGLLYQTSWQIASHSLPFGVGFGRFGSYTSSKHYSTVYDTYGLSGIWGLSRVHPAYISDTAWPSVLGESGLIGLILFFGGILVIANAAYIKLRRGSRAQEPAALALLCVLAVLMVDSLGDPNLFDWFAVLTVALLAGPVLVKLRDAEDNKDD